MTWNGDAFEKFVNAEAEKRVEAAAIYVKNQIKAAISTPSMGGKEPSAPGEPPHKDTGRLRASIAHERHGMVARVGTNVTYGKSLELGTKTMAARPFIRATYRKCLPTIMRILKGGVKG